MGIFLLRVVVCIAAASVASMAQSSRTGSLEGIVSDSKGAALAGVSVTLSSDLNAGRNRAVTDSSGRYRFEQLRPMIYVLSTESPSFQAVKRTVTVGEGGTTRGDITLDVALVTESVTVTADTDSAALKVEVPQQLNAFSEEAIGQRTTAVLSQAAEEETGISQQRTSPTIGAFLVRGLTEVGVYVDHLPARWADIGGQACSVVVPDGVLPGAVQRDLGLDGVQRPPGRRREDGRVAPSGGIGVKGHSKAGQRAPVR